MGAALGPLIFLFWDSPLLAASITGAGVSVVLLGAAGPLLADTMRRRRERRAEQVQAARRSERNRARRERRKRARAAAEVEAAIAAGSNVVAFRPRAR